MSSFTTLALLRKQTVNADGTPCPLIVTKPSWSKGYCVFIRENVNGLFKGHSYLKGNLCSQDVRIAETEPGFCEYEGPDRDRIILHEQEMANNALSALTSSDCPACKNCIHQVSGECSSHTVCDDYSLIPDISAAEKAFWPKHGDATTITKRLAKKHKEDGDPTLS